MSKVLRQEQCPVCAREGRDKSRDNLAVYADSGSHCFSCGYHTHPHHYVKPVKEDGPTNKAVLPSDFSREIPAAGWRWLLQYGLSYSYWRPYTGYSEKDGRLIFTIGKEPAFSIGRFIGLLGNGNGATSSKALTQAKWRIYGDRSRYVDVLEPENPCTTEVILVEDVISQHKVAQVATCISLFGTNLSDSVIKKLMVLGRPVGLWLDRDQYTLLAPKINRLQAFLGASVRHVSTDKDPKGYSINQIKEILV